MYDTKRDADQEGAYLLKVRSTRETMMVVFGTSVDDAMDKARKHKTGIGIYPRSSETEAHRIDVEVTPMGTL